MYIVHVILNEPYTFHFTDSYSLKYMKTRTMKYSIAIVYTDELLELKDSRYNYLFKEIGETAYNSLPYKKTDIINEFTKNPENFTFNSITNPYSLPMSPHYVYCPDIKTYVYRNTIRRDIYLRVHSVNLEHKLVNHSNL